MNDDLINKIEALKELMEKQLNRQENWIFY